MLNKIIDLPKMTLVIGLCLAAGNFPVFGQDNQDDSKTAPTNDQPEYLYAVQPEGKTLKKNMMRIRLPYRTASGNTGFDSKGKKTEPPVKVRASGGAVVIEYGLSDDISLQFLNDYVGNQEVSFDKSRFLGSAAYNDASKGVFASKFSALGNDVGPENLSGKLQGAIAAALVQNGACGTDNIATCAGQIAAGMKAPVDLPDSATSLTGLNIRKGDTLKDVIDGYSLAVNQQIEDGIMEAADDQASHTGARGMGDTTIGALYEVYSSRPLFFSVGMGVRFPTGKYKNLNGSELPTGRGLTEIGLRTNLDLQPFDALMLSWQNQSETMLTKGIKKIGSDSYDVKRIGVRNVGFFYLKPSLVPLHQSLNVLAPRLGLTYDHDSAEKIGDYAPPRSHVHSIYYALAFDLTRYSLPMQFDIEHTQPFEGRNKSVVTTANTYTLKLFYIF